MSQIDSVFDTAIAGAGPAGLVAAVRLARAGRRVILLDRAVTDTPKIGESLPASIETLFAKLDLAPLESPPHRRIPGSLSLWAGEIRSQDFVMQAEGSGWRLDRLAFEQSLANQALQAGVSRYDAWLKHCQLTDQGWGIETEDGHKVRAKWLVDATGRRSVASKIHNIKKQKSPPLIAIWGIGKATQNLVPDARTITESDDSGWWYAAHLPDHRPLAIYHTSAAKAPVLKQEPQRWLKQLVQSRLISKHIDPEAFANTELRATDARTAWLSNAYGDHWIATGDAALCFDPLSSQGIFNAIAISDMATKAILSSNSDKALIQYQQKLDEVRNIYYFGKRLPDTN
ncbi:MAG: FAD-dependent oxidoreductase [Gammaproteobacteria bacterium]|nr:FAD-dependent oxidoreductase [Gammaproteobacteria bacterium]